jgi:hypothetical protein
MVAINATIAVGYCTPAGFWQKLYRARLNIFYTAWGNRHLKKL